MNRERAANTVNFGDFPQVLSCLRLRLLVDKRYTVPFLLRVSLRICPVYFSGVHAGCICPVLPRQGVSTTRSSVFSLFMLDLKSKYGVPPTHLCSTDIIRQQRKRKTQYYEKLYKKTTKCCSIII
jgi:hypothetical protein